MQDGWMLAAEGVGDASLLARELGLPFALARLLVGRGFATAESARQYLYPCMEQLHDPSLMLCMDRAVYRLQAALTANEPILIYGDYDVDGTVATVLLKTAFERAGVAMGVAPDVRYHIPHRIREGYGMQDERISRAAEEGVRLVVSVDTGIRAFAAAEEARRVGLDLIVTDHHLPDGVAGVPEAVAVLNPNQPGCAYPYKELCGAAVAFKLAQALLEGSVPEADRTALREKTVPSFLKLLAVATIADAVPLTGENRTIAALGLRELRKPSQAGLKALMELAQIDTTRPIASGDIGFRLAPRINAAGRMDIASDVVEMFLSRDPVVARLLAEKLHRLNDERRATEAEALRSIEAQMDSLAATAAGLPSCLVLDDADSQAEGKSWHRGVIGILASRVVDRTGKPALVMTHEDGVAYGSGRSVTGFHLLDALAAVNAETKEALLTRFGGHAHAVGFALPSHRVPELRQRMEQYAADESRALSAPIEVEFDAEMRLAEVTPEFLESVSLLGPFGMSNADPLFVTRGVRLTAPPKIVKEKHIRVSVEDPEDGSTLSGMAWARRTNWAERSLLEGWSQGDFMDVAYRMRENMHPDFGGWEMEIVAVRRSLNRP